MASPTTTKALVMREKGKPLSLEELKVSRPQAQQLLVEVVACGICHTDLTCASLVSAGIIREVGSSVGDNLKVGDSVILSFNSCGVCGLCASNNPAYCSSFQLLNGPHPQSDKNTGYASADDTPVLGGFFGQSSFAQLALVDARSVVVVPDVSREELKVLAPLGCGIQTGVGSVINTLRVEKGTSFAVFGAGAVGLSAIIAAKNLGAGPIVAVDLIDSRLELAKKLGATHVFNGKDPDLVGAVKSIASANSGLRYALDTTGVVPVIQTMVQCLGALGRSVTVGVSAPDTQLSLPVMALMASGQSFGACIEGDSVPSEFIPYLVAEVKSGRFPLQDLVKFYPVDRHKEAWESMANGTAIKPVLIWD
ncbi:hypothetical protein FNYG_06846 [Fusarium nygamai]|uniref:Enoyl reductase (ER) domain-containing protein n=1 Tax=Gibberella nygamai TaxID=42673 RepID=A0A2K0WBV4_GIBNY|nr:hypothetical protein FNYG_06846 [Fusarium nygamai]